MKQQGMNPYAVGKLKHKAFLTLQIWLCRLSFKLHHKALCAVALYAVLILSSSRLCSDGIEQQTSTGFRTDSYDLRAEQRVLITADMHNLCSLSGERTSKARGPRQLMKGWSVTAAQVHNFL